MNLCRQSILRMFVLSSLLSIALASTGWGQAESDVSETEWKQWGGHARDFRLPKQNGVGSPRTKPALAWKRPLGPGHAAIVTKGKFGYSLHLRGEEEILQKWRIEDGKLAWSRRFKTSYHASYPIYDGPHSTPIVLADRIFMVSIDAKVRALDTTDGSLVWERDLRTDFGTRLPQSGYACSPIIWKESLVLPTLGESTSQETESFQLHPSVPSGRPPIPGAVALDIGSGELVWKTATFRSSHSSPVLIEKNKQPMLVFHGMFELLGVDPQNGAILWRRLLRRAAADNVSFTPIWDSQRSQILIAHGYCEFGAQAVKLQRVQGNWRTTVTWTNPHLQIVHTNAVLLNNMLIGTRRPAATLMVGVNVEDGQTLFRQRGFHKSNFVAIGNQLLILDEQGDLVGATASLEGIAERWRIRAANENAWTTPSVAGKWLLIRDSKELRVYRLR